MTGRESVVARLEISSIRSRCEPRRSSNSARSSDDSEAEATGSSIAATAAACQPSGNGPPESSGRASGGQTFARSARISISGLGSGHSGRRPELLAGFVRDDLVEEHARLERVLRALRTSKRPSTRAPRARG